MSVGIIAVLDNLGQDSRAPGWRPSPSPSYGPTRLARARVPGPPQFEEARMPEPMSALDVLTDDEKAELLDELLTAHPELREHAEALAGARLAVEDRDAVAEDVASALASPDIEDLDGRTGYQRGTGYVHPSEAAEEILDEALQPFLDDLDRRARLGHTRAAVDLASGILRGLYDCRDASPETLLAYTPDYAAERARDLIDQCHRHRIDLPTDDLSVLAPDWDALLRRSAET